MKLHPDITLDRVTEAVERHQTSLDNPGFCVACGADAEGVEPDARRYQCESCGAHAVYGAEELLIRLAAAAIASTTAWQLIELLAGQGAL